MIGSSSVNPFEKNRIPPPGCYIFPERKPDPEKTKEFFTLLLNALPPEQQKIAKKAMKQVLKELDNEK